MKKIFSIIRPDKCMECNTERSIEIFDVFDKPINYSYLLDLLESKNIDVNERLNNRQLSYMQCRRCGKIYCIDWRNRNYPVPVRAFWYLDIFLDKNYNR